MIRFRLKELMADKGFREERRITMDEVSKETGVHRTTVKRILETLRADGFVRRGEKDGQYYLTFAVQPE